MKDPATSRDVAFWGAIVASFTAPGAVGKILFAVFVWVILSMELYDVWKLRKRLKELRKEVAELEALNKCDCCPDEAGNHGPLCASGLSSERWK
jgi:hypothetical protein